MRLVYKLATFDKAAVSVKQCKIAPKLLFITNRKSHMHFWLIPKSLTLVDNETTFNGHYAAWYIMHMYFTANHKKLNNKQTVTKWQWRRDSDNMTVTMCVKVFTWQCDNMTTWQSDSDNLTKWQRQCHSDNVTVTTWQWQCVCQSVHLTMWQHDNVTKWQWQCVCQSVHLTMWQHDNVTATKWQWQRDSDKVTVTTWQSDSDKVTVTTWQWQCVSKCSPDNVTTWQRDKVTVTTWQSDSDNVTVTTWQWQHDSDNVCVKVFTWRRRSCIVRVTILLYGSTTRLRILHTHAFRRLDRHTYNDCNVIPVH